MTEPSEYTPPKVWTWNKANGGRFAKTNRPIAGPTHEKELPVGRHPLQLYSLGTPNGQKVTIMLEELLALGKSGAEYDAWLIDIGEGDQFGSGFVAVNPNSKIPALSDRSGATPIRVFESGAILLYLAEKTGKFIPHDPVKRYDTIQWLMVQMANVGPMSGQLVHFSKFAPAGQDYANARYRTQVNKIYDVYDAKLAKTAYVAGDEYTIADMAAFPWLRNVDLLAIDLSKRPHVKAWIDKIGARDAVKRAYGKIATIKSVRDSASDDAKDRFFGRGKYAVA